MAEFRIAALRILCRTIDVIGALFLLLSIPTLFVGVRLEKLVNRIDDAIAKTK